MGNVIKVELSEAGQRAALLAGEPAQKEQAYELTQELLPRALALGARVHEDGSVTLLRNGFEAYRILDTRPANAEAAIAAFEAADAQERVRVAERKAREDAQREELNRAFAQKREAAAETLRAISDEQIAAEYLRRGFDGKPTDSEVCACAGLPDLGWAANAELVESRMAGVAAVVERLRAAAEAEAEVLAAQHRAQIREAIALRADPDQLERFDAGVLPADELSAMLEEHLFAPFADCDPYRRLVQDDVEHAEYCGGDTKFKSEVVINPPLTAHQWGRLKALRAIVSTIPGAELEIREHAGYCADDCRECNASTVKLGARVTIEFAGEVCQQEFAL